MAERLSDVLSAFSDTDYSVRAVRGLLSVLPFVPDWKHPGTLEQAAARLDPALAARVAAQAEVLIAEPQYQAALKAFEMMDKSDKGIALFSGLKAGVQGMRGQDGALEMDPQQAADAGLKAIGVAYAAWKLFPGSTQEKLQSMLATETGRSLLVFYVAVDVVLPFADNLASGGLDVMTGIVDRYANENIDQLASVAGAEVQEAKGMLQALSGTLHTYLGQAASFAKPLSAWAQEKLPGMLGTADKVTGVVATAIDALSTYRYMGGVLVSEVVLHRALSDVRAQVAAEAQEAERKQREAEAQRLIEEERKRREEEERKARSKVQNDYKLGESVAAAAGGVKYTRSAELDAQNSQVPAKKGCMGCMGLILAAIVLGTATSVYAMVY